MIDVDKVFEKFSRSPYARHMQGVSHAFDEDNLNPYHLEGSIWNHTLMVYEKSKDDSIFLQLATIFHDLGKTISKEKVVQDGIKHTRFIGHEGASFYIAQDAMKKMGVYDEFDDDDIQLILSIIACHGEYRMGGNLKKFFDRFQRNELLLSFIISHMKCDFAGRFTDASLPHTDVEVLETEHRHWLRSRQMDSNELQPREYENTITLLVGAPCSGKSYWIERLSKRMNVNVAWDTRILSRDDLVYEMGKCETYDECWKNVDHKKIDEVLEKRFRATVKEDKDIIVDMTNMSRKSRRRWLHGVKKSYKKKAVMFATSLDTLLDRDRARAGKTLGVRFLHPMIKKLSIPMYDEFDEIEWVIDRN